MKKKKKIRALVCRWSLILATPLHFRAGRDTASQSLMATWSAVKKFKEMFLCFDEGYYDIGCTAAQSCVAKIVNTETENCDCFGSDKMERSIIYLNKIDIIKA